jgi:uncharacterized protein with PIN domain
MAVRGYVYVMTSKSLPELVKVGYSLKEPTLRAIELSSTGVPHPFVVAYDVFVFNPKEVEQAVHRKFRNEGRHESKEFFRTSVADAIVRIKQVLIAQKKDVLMENCTGAIAVELVEQSGAVTESKANYCHRCRVEFSKSNTKCMYCNTDLVPKPKPIPIPIPIPITATTERTCPKCGATYRNVTHCMYCKVSLTER